MLLNDIFCRIYWTDFDITSNRIFSSNLDGEDAKLHTHQTQGLFWQIASYLVTYFPVTKM